MERCSSVPERCLCQLMRELALFEKPGGLAEKATRHQRRETSSCLTADVDYHLLKGSGWDMSNWEGEGCKASRLLISVMSIGDVLRLLY